MHSPVPPISAVAPLTMRPVPMGGRSIEAAVAMGTPRSRELLQGLHGVWAPEKDVRLQVRDVAAHKVGGDRVLMWREGM